MSRVLALVPARGGSKGIPDKNIRPLAGRTLLEYAARVSAESGVIDRIVLSTDSERIAEEGRRVGLEVPFLRPFALAQDDTPMLPVIEHAVDFVAGQGWEPGDHRAAAAHLAAANGSAHPGRRSGAARLRGGFGRDRRRAAAPSVARLRHACGGRDGSCRFCRKGRSITRTAGCPAVRLSATEPSMSSGRRHLRESRSIYGRTCRPLVVPAEESITIDSPEDWLDAERRMAAAEK